MSVRHFLFRVKRIGPDTMASLDLGQLLPPHGCSISMGPVSEVETRLLALPSITRAVPIDELLNQIGGGPAIELPQVGNLPPMRHLTLFNGESEYDLTLNDDPVSSIGLDRVAPAAMLPVVEALRDLGPFVIIGSDGEKYDPARLAMREPIREPPPFEVRVLEAKADGQQLLLPRWSLSTRRYLNDRDRPILVGGRLILSVGGHVSGLDPSTGECIWGLGFGRGGLHLTPASGYVVAAGDYEDLYSISISDGSLHWRIPVEGRLTAPAAVCDDGLVAVGSATGWVAAVSPEDGKIRWTKRLSAAVYTAVRPTGNLLLVPTNDGVVHALRQEDGEEVGAVRIGTNWVEIDVVSRWAFIRAQDMRSGGLWRFCLPDLDGPVQVDDLGPGFGSFLASVGDGRLANCRCGTDGKSVISLIDPSTLEVIRELPCETEVTRPVPLGNHLWAVGLRPRREDWERHQALAILDSAEGQFVYAQDLPGKGWYDFSVIGENDWLFATWKKGKEDYRLQAFQVNTARLPMSR